MKAALPRTNAPVDSYEARLNMRLQRELDDLHATVEQLQQGRLATRLYAPAAPTGGAYAVGDQVLNSAPSELGGAGSKYTLVGWICVVAGSPGTWRELRTLTGN
jgi:hypothetical protein